MSTFMNGTHNGKVRFDSHDFISFQKMMVIISQDDVCGVRRPESYLWSPTLSSYFRVQYNQMMFHLNMKQEALKKDSVPDVNGSSYFVTLERCIHSGRIVRLFVR